MNKRILNLCRYNKKKINIKIVYLTALALLGSIIHTLFTYEATNVKALNMWDFYSVMFLQGGMEIIIILLLSFYFTFSCFENRKRSIYTKIRAGNSAIWFLSNIISIFIFNIISILLFTAIVLIIGAMFWGGDLGWSSISKMYPRPHILFYSPIKLVMLNIITYSFFATFLAELIGFSIVKFDKRIITSILTVAYLIFNRIPKLRYISFEVYMDLGRRSYYLNMNPNNYMTVKQGLFIPIILAATTGIILTGVYFIKKNISIRK